MIEKQFAKMGARAVVEKHPQNRFDLDVKTDSKGEFFLIRVPGDRDIKLQATEVREDLRHLLLHVDDPYGDPRRRTKEVPKITHPDEHVKEKYLCGHDERHWFAANVGNRGVNGVTSAMEFLRPLEVDQELSKKKVRAKNKNKRRNKAYRRQGEWFFMARPDFDPTGQVIHKDEPIQRNPRSKPHIVEELIRTGGHVVYVTTRHPQGMSPEERNHLFLNNPEAKKWDWRTRVAEPKMYVRGKVRHPDHATITLHGWHEVEINEERTSSNLRFID
jgi:hypothetical protein